MIKPKLSELSQELNELTWAEVKSMSVQLDMDYDELRKIEEQSSQFTNHLHSSMNLWLKTDKNASWIKIVKALEACGKTVLADDIKEKYCMASSE